MKIIFFSCRLDFGPVFNSNPILVKGNDEEVWHFFNRISHFTIMLIFLLIYERFNLFLQGNGDGTVNRRSLIGCGYWEPTQTQKIYQQEFQGIEHYNMLSNAAPINYILNRLTGDNDYPRPAEKVNYSDMMKIRLF